MLPCDVLTPPSPLCNGLSFGQGAWLQVSTVPLCHKASNLLHSPFLLCQAAEALEALEVYPAEPEVHKYLLDRLTRVTDLDQLYELHYQMITLGKVRSTGAGGEGGDQLVGRCRGGVVGWGDEDSLTNRHSGSACKTEATTSDQLTCCVLPLLLLLLPSVHRCYAVSSCPTAVHVPCSPCVSMHWQGDHARGRGQCAGG